MVLKSIGPMSCAKVSGVLYALLGLIVGFFFSIFGLIGAAIGGDSSMGALFGIGAIVIMPIFYGVLGFVSGLIVAFIFNLVVGWVGGIEMKFDQTPQQQPPPMQQPM